MQEGKPPVRCAPAERTRKNRHCFVPGCKTGYHCDRRQKKMAGEKNCSVFSPPAGPLFELWKMSIPRKDRELSRKDVVCELHFTEKCIERFFIIPGLPDGITARLPRSIPRLKTGSIPSIFPKDLKPPVRKGRKTKHSERTVIKRTNVASSLKCISTFNKPIHVSNDCTVTNVLSDQSKLLVNIVNSNPVVKVVEQEQSDIEGVTASLNFSSGENLSPITFDDTVLNPSICEVHLLENTENRNPFTKIIDNGKSNFEDSMSNMKIGSTEQCCNLLSFNTLMTAVPNQLHLLKNVEIRNSSAESIPASNMSRTGLNYPASNTCVPDIDGHTFFSKELADSTMCSNSKPKSYVYKTISNHVPTPQVCRNYPNDASTSSKKNFTSNGESHPVVASEAAEPKQKTLIDELKEDIEKIPIPNNWGWIQGIPDIIACVKWDENYSVERKLIFDLNLNIKVFLGAKEVILMEETPSSIEQISAILWKIDNLEICKGTHDNREVSDCVVVISTARQSLTGCGRFCDNCLAYKKRKARALWHEAVQQIISSKNRSKKIPSLKKKNNRLRKKIAVLKRNLKIEQTCTAAALDFFF